MNNLMAYNKFFAAIGSVIVTRWALQSFQIDVNALGISDDLRGIVSLAIDGFAAGVSGFFVWLIPNIKKVL